MFPAPRLLVATAALAAAGAVSAQAAPDLRAAAYLASNCANCHGTNGRSLGAMPELAGIPKERFVTLMRDFRDGKRQATLMHQLAKGYSDEQIVLLGEFFSRQSAK
jgi:cytochrome c553